MKGFILNSVRSVSGFEQQLTPRYLPYKKQDFQAKQKIFISKIGAT